MSSFSQDKGKRAERQVVQLMQPVVIEVWRELEATKGEMGACPCLERNLMQSHKGGHDIVGFEWLALEVKHREVLAIDAWWMQTKQQAAVMQERTDLTVEPVLIWKQNRTKWQVRMFGFLQLGERRIRCPVDIPVETFLIWFKHRLLIEFA